MGTKQNVEETFPSQRLDAANFFCPHLQDTYALFSGSVLVPEKIQRCGVIS